MICSRSPLRFRKAAIRRALDELVALGLIEVREDQHGEQRSWRARATFRTMWAGRSDQR